MPKRRPRHITSNLEDWVDIQADRRWPALLIGNGSSQAIWPKFGYPSLVEVADLSDNDREIFTTLESSNFEEVLAALRMSALICRQMGHRHAAIERRYRHIKEALIGAVNQVHVPWLQFSAGSQQAIGRELLRYRRIYSTNYDLLAYWALRGTGNPSAYGDYFWGTGGTFDITDTDAPPSRSMIHYLHGGLHLYRSTDGETFKRSAPQGSNLLDLLGSAHRGVDIPLFVSEASSKAKVRVIRSSDYLSFCLQRLAAEGADTVVFGHSLSEQDAHIVHALLVKRKRFAVALRPARSTRVIAEKARILALLAPRRVRFFDATTHPLGAASVRAT